MITFSCFACDEVQSFQGRLGFRADCQKCGQDLHCCKQCEFYDPKVYNECRETSAEVIRVKDRSNYCEYFQVSKVRGDSSVAKERDHLLAAAEALFKKK